MMAYFVKVLDCPQNWVVHSMGLHMHYLGTSGSLSVIRSGGDRDCLLEIPEWDSDWQFSYVFRDKPMLPAPPDVDPSEPLPGAQLRRSLA